MSDGSHVEALNVDLSTKVYLITVSVMALALLAAGEHAGQCPLGFP